MIKTVKQSFHCILGILMLEKVENCPALAGKNLSEKIDFLLEALFRLIEKSHLREDEKGSSYEYVGDSKHKVFYLSPENYRHLKQLHQDLNFYSIAQILRKIIALFLAMVEKHGSEKVWDRIDDLIRRIKKRRKKRKFIDKRRFLFHMKGRPVLEVVYNENFQAIAFRFRE